MSRLVPSDAAIREQALDPRLCCIVQAPAGSGKTELLIQRMLVLLAQVERPEEILAITFTRKAAGEMRNRLLQALREADAPLPEDAPEHVRCQRQRAQAVLARDRELGWNLLTQPGRLRIQTIDAFSHALAARLPLTARFGAFARISDDPQSLYCEAAKRVIERIESEEAGSGEDDVAALQTLLTHLGNDLGKARNLLAAMLGKRDQWGRHVFTGADTPLAQRAALEAAIQRMIEDELRALDALFPQSLRAQTTALTAQLCHHLRAEGKVKTDDERLLWEGGHWPEQVSLAHWQALARFFLTTDGVWRKRFTVNEGVPNAKTDKKRNEALKHELQVLLKALEAHPDLASALHASRDIPAPAYTEAEWAVLHALLHLLKLAWSELWLVFTTRGEVDFIEVAQAALRALGEDERPSDLLLAFDYRLRHILVDEFQDTSHTQFALLERLLSGWQPGERPFTEQEGRTLFLVGDPMQSIYRFREAEVGLFLRAQREGIRCGGGVLHLAPLTLSTNFRSQAGVVEWVNAVFPRVLAERENIAEGAVPYTPSTAYHPKGDGEAVSLRFLPKVEAADARDGLVEAAEVARLAAKALAELAEDGAMTQADRSVAILVRSRTHLARILPALRGAGIPFQAVEIEQLAKQPIVQDLLTLTRALLHLADRIAWLALLRAPWCGLELADLHHLAEGGDSITLWQAMHEEARLAALTAKGRARLLRVRAVLQVSLQERGQVSLRRQVEGAWLALGGPACCKDVRELEEARIFFDLLDTLSHVNSDNLERALEKLYAPPASEARVQVMTIHKAKGLQFHTVIVPGLAEKMRGRDSQLLLWLEREVQRLGGREADLLLAPIQGVGEGTNRLYAWLRKIQGARDRYEEGRLLYVAATRAIQRLYWVAELELDQDGGWKVDEKSLLVHLWPGIESEVPAPRASGSSDAASVFAQAAETEPPPPTLRRLPLEWQPPVPPPAIPVDSFTLRPLSRQLHGAGPYTGIAGDEDDTLRHVGTLVHRLLERIAIDGIAAWSTARLAQMAPALRRNLQAMGVARTKVDEAMARVVRAVESTLDDPRGRWILDAHQQARCEWALVGVIGTTPVSAVIDRSFIDQGVRWIIDYKTAEPAAGEPLADFLARQQAHYRGQLEGYAGLLTRLDPGCSVRLGLYFPLCAAWCEWSAPSGKVPLKEAMMAEAPKAG